jgi:hypothetical protein
VCVGTVVAATAGTSAGTVILTPLDSAAVGSAVSRADGVIVGSEVNGSDVGDSLVGSGVGLKGDLCGLGDGLYVGDTVVG